MGSLSKQSEALILAYNKGYRVVNGEVISPSTNKALKLREFHRGKTGNEGAYLFFKIVSDGGVRRQVMVHRLLAYQKYKEKMFRKGILIRHLDGNSLNNDEANIAMGTQSDNMRDRPPEELKAHAINAATKRRRFTDAEIEEIRVYRAEGHIYTEIMERFNISSTGTLHNILNNNYVTKKD